MLLLSKEKNNSKKYQQIQASYHLQQAIKIYGYFSYGERKDRKLRIFILHAHIHHYHRVDMKCTKAGSIPSIYVGSVPNNRYITIEL